MCQEMFYDTLGQNEKLTSKNPFIIFDNQSSKDSLGLKKEDKKRKKINSISL